MEKWRKTVDSTLGELAEQKQIVQELAGEVRTLMSEIEKIKLSTADALNRQNVQLTHRRVTIQPERFVEGDDPATYIRSFEYVARCNGWDERDMVQYFCFQLNCRLQVLCGMRHSLSMSP